MSHATRIIGIPGLEIERVDHNKGIEVWARPTHRPVCQHCSSNSLVIKATHQPTLKHTRQGNRVMALHLRVPKCYCAQCGR